MHGLRSSGYVAFKVPVVLRLSIDAELRACAVCYDGLLAFTRQAQQMSAVRAVSSVT